jgi:hypothetical protein
MMDLGVEISGLGWDLGLDFLGHSIIAVVPGGKLELLGTDICPMCASGFAEAWCLVAFRVGYTLNP